MLQCYYLLRAVIVYNITMYGLDYHNSVCLYVQLSKAGISGISTDCKTHRSQLSSS